jgi:uncharacterized membrane protein YccC
MTKTDEAFQEALQALRDWLVFLDDQEKEYREQLERARRKAESAPAPAAVETVEEEEKTPPTENGEGNIPAWL